MKRKPTKHTRRRYPSAQALLHGKNTDPRIIAAQLSVPVENVRSQYRKNALQLAKMARLALKTGKMVNGYTAAELMYMVTMALERSMEKR